jgi:hypothetical protein
MLTYRRVRLLASFIFAAMAGAVAQAMETPGWAALEAMYGQTLESAPVRSLVERYKLRRIPPRGPSGSLGATDHSYTLSYNSNEIDCIFFQVAPWPPGHGGWSTYAGDLPFGLKPWDDREAVVGRLGASTAEGSGHFQFQGYRLVILFRESGRGIQDIYIFKDVKRPGLNEE